jgi:hypothetical protein
MVAGAVNALSKCHSREQPLAISSNAAGSANRRAGWRRETVAQADFVKSFRIPRIVVWRPAFARLRLEALLLASLRRAPILIALAR